MPVPESDTAIATYGPALAASGSGPSAPASTSRGAELEHAAGRHGVLGVDRQVHQDLFELPAIGGDEQTLTRGRHAHLDVLADQPLQHLPQLPDQLVDVEGGRLHHLPPAERQQLLGQLGGPLGGFDDLVHVAVLALRPPPASPVMNRA